MPLGLEPSRGDVLIQRLDALVTALDLDRRDFIIFGSGPLFAHGLCTQIDDLDVVARGAVWSRVREIGERGVGTINGAPMAQFWGGLIQFSQGWISPEWDTDELIGRAETVRGLPFAPLADVLAYKEELRRDKDLGDIEILQHWLGHNFDAAGTGDLRGGESPRAGAQHRDAAARH